jgi:hypothetical protein
MTDTKKIPIQRNSHDR